MKKALFILAVAGFFAACGGAKQVETPVTETPVEEVAPVVEETPMTETPVEEVPAVK